MGFTSTQTVPVGACSNPINVPAGTATVRETGDPATFVSAITALPAGRLISSDLPTATATVGIAAGDGSNGTVLTFTNSVSPLKICKVAGGVSLVGVPFSFTVTGAAMSPISIAAGAGPGGNCVLVTGATPFRARTT